MTTLNKPELGGNPEKFLNVFGSNLMFCCELLDNLLEPDEAGDFQVLALCRIFASGVESERPGNGSV